MRILSIKGNNITSLNDFTIDFREEPLKSTGLFSIIGATGAGKSSILDTMTLALYQKIARLDGVEGSDKIDSEIGEISNNNIFNIVTKGQTDCFAQVEFVAKDNLEYRAYWGYRLPKRKGSKPQEELRLVRIHDNITLSDKKKDCNEQVEKLIGLNYDQFTRTILLAQGKFAEFLKAKEENRAELLEKLTGTEVYRKIGEKVFAKSKEAQESIAKIKQNYEEKNSVIISKTEIDDLEKECIDIDKIIQESRGWQENANIILTNNLRVISSKKEFNSISDEIKKIDISVYEKEEQNIKAKIELLEIEYEQHKLKFDEYNNLNSNIIADKSKISSLEKQQQDNDQNKIKLDQEVKEWQKELESSQDKLNRCKNKVEEHKVNEKKIDNWQTLNSNINRYKEEQRNISALEQEHKEIKNKLNELNLAIVQKQKDINSCKVIIGSFSEDTVAERSNAFSKRKEDILIAKQCIKINDDIEVNKGDVQKITNELEVLKKEYSEKYNRYKDVLAKFELSNKAISENVKKLRASLQSGEPCPVCGSSEHKYLNNNDHLDELNNLLKKDKETLEYEVKNVNDIIVSKTTTIENKNKNIQQSQKELLSICEQNLEFINFSKAAIEEEEEKLKEEQSLIQKIKDKFIELNKFNYELELLNNSIKSNNEQIERISNSIQEKNTIINELCLKITEFWDSDSWKTECLSNDFSDKWETINKHYNIARNGIVEHSKKCEVLNVSISKNKNDLANILDSFSKISGEIIALKSEIDKNITLRNNLLNSKTVDQVNNEFNLATKELSINLQTTLAKKSEEHNKLSNLEGKQDALMISINQDTEKIENSLKILNKQHSDIDEIAIEFKNLNYKIESLTTKKVENNQKIENNKIYTKELDELKKAYEQQNNTYEHWSKLNSLIGSSDGKKFAKIAQSVTLGILLKYANDHLRSISDRYTLYQNENNMSLAFWICDNEQYEKTRPVHTLSGGETFIVSLALALGLSSMTSSDLIIESLFIDEGFGSLDSDTLKTVMNVLSQLQSYGRKIGVVTHVEEMKTEIPVSILVEKVGSGRSVIKVQEN